MKISVVESVFNEIAEIQALDQQTSFTEKKVFLVNTLEFYNTSSEGSNMYSSFGKIAAVNCRAQFDEAVVTPQTFSQNILFKKTSFWNIFRKEFVVNSVNLIQQFNLAIQLILISNLYSLRQRNYEINSITDVFLINFQTLTINCFS